MDGKAYFQQVIREHGNDKGPREEAIWKAVQNGDIVGDWVPLEFTTPGGARAMIFVLADTLQVGEPGASVRVCVSQRLGQQIADHLQCILPTASLSDTIWRNADLKLPPATQRWYDPSPQDPNADGTMGMTKRMLDFHDIIERQLAGRGFRLLAGHHKDWINTPLLGTEQNPAHAQNGGILAVNYGWHNKTGTGSRSQTIPGVSVIQGPGRAHDWSHSDYSQLLRLIARAAYVCRGQGIAGLGGFNQAGGSVGNSFPDDGAPCTTPAGNPSTWEAVDIYEFMFNPDLHSIVAHEPTNYKLRHPALSWATADDENNFTTPQLLSSAGGGSSLTAAEKLGALGLGAVAGHIGLSVLRKLSKHAPSR